MSQIPAAIRDHLQNTIIRYAPARLMIVAPASVGNDLFDEAAAGQAELVQSEPEKAFRKLGDGARYELAVVLAMHDNDGSMVDTRVIGRLRDVNAGSVVVAATLQEATPAGRRPWQTQDFIALGFRRAPETRDLAPGWGIFRYDIHDYKTTPSWLNSRYWANPRRWDKERW